MAIAFLIDDGRSSGRTTRASVYGRAGCVLRAVNPLTYDPPMRSTEPRQIGARVRAIRGKTGLTQADLAEACGLSAETIGRLERGAYEPSLSTMMLVVQALHTPIEDVLLGEGGGNERPEKAHPPLVRRLAASASLLDPVRQRALLHISTLMRGRRKTGR